MLVAERVYLHIGAPKAGSTFVQTVLWTNKERLRAAGVLLPGELRGHHNSVAVWARTPEPSPGTNKNWERLSGQIRDWPGSAILSSEWFTMVAPQLIDRFLRELSPAEVHVVYTVRSLLSTVPAAWQERLKLGDACDLDKFFASLETSEHPRWNWDNLDPARVLDRWAEFVAPSRIHLVTIPPVGRDRSLLWHRFAEACGLVPTDFVLDKAFGNQSISVESARLLQLIGPDLRRAVDADTKGGLLPYRWIRDYLSHEVLAAQPGNKISLPQDARDALQERSRGLVADLERRDYHVVGDLQELLVDEVPDTALHPSSVTNDALLEVALSTIPPMLGRLRVERERAERARKRAARLQLALDECEAQSQAEGADVTARPREDGRDGTTRRLARRSRSYVRRLRQLVRSR